nr:unnamed protein product [Spirometra erinaceieuropaei]
MEPPYNGPCSEAAVSVDRLKAAVPGIAADVPLWSHIPRSSTSPDLSSHISALNETSSFSANSYAGAHTQISLHSWRSERHVNFHFNGVASRRLPVSEWDTVPKCLNSRLPLAPRPFLQGSPLVFSPVPSTRPVYKLTCFAYIPLAMKLDERCFIAAYTVTLLTKEHSEALN